MDPSNPPSSPDPTSTGPSEPATSGMNRYGRLAMLHWASYLPDRYAQIPDPAGFFTTMGREIAEEIADLSAQLATQQAQEPTYLAEVGRLNRLRSQAEEQVLNERIFQTTQTAPQTEPTQRP
jgi:hypothetical protein